MQLTKSKTFVSQQNAYASKSDTFRPRPHHFDSTYGTPNLNHTLKKSSYDKANPSILKREGTMEALRSTWIAHPSGILDPTTKFILAQIHLRRKYKALQKQANSPSQPLDLLLDQLVQLKLDIFDNTNPQLCQEYHQVRNQIREIELNEANRL